MNGPRNVPQPIPYQGSKRQIAPVILSHFPLSFTRLVEPFAGSAAISIAVANRKMTSAFWINDAHSPLMTLWKAMLQHPDELADQYERLWNEQLGQERVYFDKIRARFNESHDPADFLYLLARCVKAAIRYNSNGEFNNTPDNRRRGAKPDEMRRRILTTHELLGQKTKTTDWDYRKVLAKCRAGDLIYMDPPYQGVCGNRDSRYLPTIDHAEFCQELERLNKRGLMYAVSYDGRTGDKTYGEALPESLNLVHLEIEVGRSSQATLLGRNEITYESLYLSSSLAKKAENKESPQKKRQLTFA